jgi:hypothetical protein
MANGTIEQRQGAIDIIIAYSGSKETRDLFVKTLVCKETLRLLLIPADSIPAMQLRVSALTCLINFS